MTTNTETHLSTTGAAKSRLILADGKSPLVVLHVPVGAGRRFRMELGIGQARALSEVLAMVLDDVERLLPPPRKPEGR